MMLWAGRRMLTLGVSRGAYGELEAAGITPLPLISPADAPPPLWPGWALQGDDPNR